MSSLDTSITNISVPTIAVAFHAAFQATQWIVLAYLLALTSLIVSCGRLGDIVGRRRLLIVGVSLFTAASLLCGLAPTLPLLIAARALQGVGAAVMMALTTALISETVPKERTGSAIGLLGTMSATGTALGPSLGGLILARFGWQEIFLVQVPLGMLALLLVWRFLPIRMQSTSTQKPRFDNLGTFLLGSTLAAYALAMTIKPATGHFGEVNLYLLTAFVIGVALFIYLESKVASPLFRLSLFGDRKLTASLLTSALITTVMMSTLVVGPFYLSRGLGLSPAMVGICLSIGPIVSALTGAPAGRVVDRFGTQAILLSGLISMMMAAVLIASLPSSYGVIGYLLPLVILTASYASFQAANNTAIMSNVSTDQKGVVSGLLSLARNLGLITGVSAMGAVFAITSGAPDIAVANQYAIVMGMHWTFTVAAILIGLTLVLAYWRQRK
jgi:EmrB/QacA subfamily drug resistance transporter